MPKRHGGGNRYDGDGETALAALQSAKGRNPKADNGPLAKALGSKKKPTPSKRAKKKEVGKSSRGDMLPATGKSTREVPMKKSEGKTLRAQTQRAGEVHDSEPGGRLETRITR